MKNRKSLGLAIAFFILQYLAIGCSSHNGSSDAGMDASDGGNGADAADGFDGETNTTRLHGLSNTGRYLYFITDLDNDLRRGVLQYIDVQEGMSATISSNVHYRGFEHSLEWVSRLVDTSRPGSVLFARNCVEPGEGCELVEWSHEGGESILVDSVDLVVGHWTHSLDLSRLAFSTGEALKIFDWDRREIVAEVAIDSCHYGWSSPFYPGFFLSPDGARLAFANHCTSGLSQLWFLDVDSGQTTMLEENVFNSKEQWSSSLELVDGGTKLIFLTEDHRLMLWDFSSEAPQLLQNDVSVHQSGDRFYKRLIDQDGTRLLSNSSRQTESGYIQTLWLIDLANPSSQPIAEGKITGDYQVSSSFKLVVFQYNGTISLYDLEQGTLREVIPDDSGFVFDLSEAAFGPDETSLLLVSYDDQDYHWTVHLHDVASGETSEHLVPLPVGERHSDLELSWRFDANDAAVLSKNQDGNRELRYWRLEESQATLVSDDTIRFALRGQIWADNRLIFPECTDRDGYTSCDCKLFDLDSGATSTFAEDMQSDIYSSVHGLLFRSGDWVVWQSDWDEDKEQGNLYLRSLAEESAQVLGSAYDINYLGTVLLTPQHVFYVSNGIVELVPL